MRPEHHLLPPNCTVFEQALSLANDVLPRLGSAADTIRRFKVAPSDALLPWLLWEYGLDDFAHVVPDLRQRLHEGLVLQRLRGTPAGLYRALSLLGLGEVTLVEGLPAIAHDARRVRNRQWRYGQPGRWAQFQLQIDLGNRAGWAGALPTQVRALVQAMQPARCHLAGLLVLARVRQRASAQRTAQPLWHLGAVLASQRPGPRNAQQRRGTRLQPRRDGHVRYDALQRRSGQWTGPRFAPVQRAGWFALRWRPTVVPARTAQRDARLHFDGTQRRSAFAAHAAEPILTLHEAPP